MKRERSCIHCGADCGRDPVILDEKSFCCTGCKTVYQLLNEKKLYKYYELDETPGVKVDYSGPKTKFAYLDNQEVIDKIVSFREGNISKVKFFIPEIHCASCIWLLENLKKLNSGIKFSIVNFTRKEADITFDHTLITLREVVELLSSIHYIPDLSVNISEKIEDRNAYKKLLYKIGVAGFAFINVMTYSLPAYFKGELLSYDLQSLFNILSYILVIPVALYSGSDYYISAFKNLAKRNISIDLPIALGILVLFLVTSYEVLFAGGPGYSDSLSGLVFFLLVGRWYQGKTYEALSFDRNYKSYFPIAVTKINKQLEESILLEKVQKGDVLIIRNKELIPADSVLIEGQGQIDYSFVTGESTPVLKKESDFIYAGGRQMGGIIKVKVKKAVSQSHLTKLWNQSSSDNKPSSTLTSLSDKISQYFTLVIITVAVLGFLFRALFWDIHSAIFVFTAVLIVACPCALALSIPFTFGNTMRIFGKNRLYIKNSSVIERLSKIDTVVFDKTGTLTQPKEAKVTYKGSPLSKKETEAVFSLARQSTHPLSHALVTHLKESSYIPPDHFTELPGRGVFGKVNGMEIRMGSGEYVNGAELSKEHEASVVYLAINNTGRGCYSFSNLYRPGMGRVLKTLKADFKLYLLSGDNDSERDNLGEYFDQESMHFDQKPAAKAKFISQLQKEDHTVLMTGDGLNDAGALMQSDVALTVANKVYHFSPASDAVLEAEAFEKLDKFIQFSRTAINIVKVSFIISFLYNIIGISYALSGQLSPIIAAILMPVSSVSVVSFATFATRQAGKKRLRSN